MIDLLEEVHTLKEKLSYMDTELEEMRMKVHMMDLGTTSLYQISMMNKSTKIHEELRYKKNKACM